MRYATMLLTAATVFTAGVVSADSSAKPASPASPPVSKAQYEVTITNLTRAQRFTPILVATHEGGVQLFELGQPASPELATLAEEGNNGPLAALLAATPGVLAVSSSAGLLNPGASVTVLVAGGTGGADSFSVAGMLIPTNDAFFAINNAPGPRGGATTTLLAPAYDSGSERNTETCASIPGPFFMECGGPGGGAKIGGGEGFVHIHAGIHGIGDLKASERDWRNPVARVQVRRVR